MQIYNQNVVALEEDVSVFPTSFAQQRLWFLDQLDPGDPTYNIPIAVRLRGKLEVAALTESLNELVRRHEPLRTTFSTPDGEPVQVVARELSLPLPLLTLRDLPETEREAKLQSVIAREAQKPFDLARGPLLRTVLVQLDENDHVLLVTIHHIISDAWSNSILIGEIAALYASFITGQPAALPELSGQYADFAVWQRNWLQGEVFERQLSYWRQKLNGLPGVVELPADYPRPPARTFRAGTECLSLPESLSESLRVLSRQQRVTLFMVLLAAFKVLLSRYTGQDDIVIGSPIAGRNRVETRGVIGCFLNTLVLRTDLSGSPTFLELLARVRKTTVEGYTNQDAPFEKLLEELQPERDLSRTPLFNIFVNMLNLRGGNVQLPGLEVEFLMPPEVGAKFDLTLYVRELNQEIAFEAVYNADLYKPERIAEMLRQLEHLLAQIAAHPEYEIGQFSLVTPASRSLLPNPAEPLRDDWEGAVHSLFSRHAARAPERLAVVDRFESWTYRELDELSNQLANYLHEQGVMQGDVVAIYAYRSSSLVWALLGVLKAGAAFVILDPAYPASRLIDYLELAEPKGWIQLEDAGALPESLSQFVSTLSCKARLTLAAPHKSREGNQLAAYPTTAPDVTVQPDDLAYLAFTSGSTGKPKAVEGRHGPLTHFLPWMQRVFKLDENDRYSMLSGLSHDPLHRDIFTPLTLGACICIPEQRLIENQSLLLEWMQEQKISIANLTPAMGQFLADTGPGAEPRTLTTLRYAFLVGDVLTKRDVARLKKIAPALRCINFYGATETQRAVSYYAVSDEAIAAYMDETTSAQGKEILPLGKGIEDVQLLVLNQAQQLAAIGELGEIYMRSPHVARGYRGDAALTGEKFLRNPFGNHAGDRLYRTGDLGRYLPDGNVEPLGRADLQVKIRGFRVEPGEIEALLRGLPSIRDVVVIAREDRPGDKRLVAYVVPEAATTVAPKTLRDFLKQKLPEYMVPSAFVMLDALPLTPNMKVDRKALPAPQSGKEFGTEFVAARTRLEQRLVEIWCEVLKLESCGVEDNFFDLGGHSLLALQVQARVRREFEVDVPLRRMFETPNVAGIAQCIEELRPSEKLRQAPPLQRAERTDSLPLSFAQQRLWFLNQLEPDSPFYNIHILLRLTGSLDVAVLKRTLNEIVRRHEVLRTNYRVVNEQPAQVISPELSLELSVLDIRNVAAELRESEMQRLAGREACQPFDLADGPLLRTSLIQLQDEEYVLVLTMHHIISDGWSTGVLAHEVAVLYKAFAANQQSPLAELPIQYADFALWQREWLQTEAVTNQLDYWKRQLADLPLLKLPVNSAPATVSSYRGKVSSFLLDQTLTGELKALSRSEGVTLFVTLLAAFQLLLNRHSGQEDIVVGTDVANRFPIETEQLMGFFVNQLVLRTDLSHNPTFRELMRRVQDVTLDAYEHQDVLFDKIVEALRPDRSRSRTPLFQAKLVLQNAPIEALALPGLKIEHVTLEQGTRTAKFDLLLTTVETIQGLGVNIECSAELFDDDAIAQFSQRFTSLVREIVARPDARLSEFADFRETRTTDTKQVNTRIADIKKFKKIQPKALSLERGELIKKHFLSPEDAIPLVLEPQLEILDLVGWLKNNWRSVEADLLKHGALLFRGFDVPDQAAFAQVVGATSVPLMQYMEGATPRSELGGKVYTSTEYPPDQSIALHNELTYVMTWPMKIWFYCLQPAQERGETPIADVRKVMQRLDPRIKARFAEKGWLLVRNFGEGLSLPWQTSFHLQTKTELEAYCRSAKIEWRWKPDDGLQTRQRRPAIAKHPVTGEVVWFNHVAFWHISSLEPELREAMLALFGEENLSYNTYYGDGTSIEDSVVAEIREAYREETRAFPWQHGDILMLDNMLVAHGRNPFVGPRRILVAMGEPYTRLDF